MTGLDVVMLIFLGFLFGVFVGAMGIAFSHDARMEKRRRAAVLEATNQAKQAENANAPQTAGQSRAKTANP